MVQMVVTDVHQLASINPVFHIRDDLIRQGRIGSTCRTQEPRVRHQRQHGLVRHRQVNLRFDGSPRSTLPNEVPTTLPDYFIQWALRGSSCTRDDRMDSQDQTTRKRRVVQISGTEPLERVVFRQTRNGEPVDFPTKPGFISLRPLSGVSPEA